MPKIFSDLLKKYLIPIMYHKVRHQGREKDKITAFEELTARSGGLFGTDVIMLFGTYNNA